MIVGVAVGVVAAVSSIAAHDVLAGAGGVPASAADGRSALVRRSITAQPGDSLWSIARVHRGDVPLVRFVDKLVDLNGGPAIAAGQQVILP